VYQHRETIQFTQRLYEWSAQDVSCHFEGHAQCAEGGEVTKQRKRKPATPRTYAELLAEQMEAAATIVWTVSEKMECFAGFYPKTRDRPLRVAAWSVMLRTWASEVREQANNQKGGLK